MLMGLIFPVRLYQVLLELRMVTFLPHGAFVRSSDLDYEPYSVSISQPQLARRFATTLQSIGCNSRFSRSSSAVMLAYTLKKKSFSLPANMPLSRPHSFLMP